MSFSIYYFYWDQVLLLIRAISYTIEFFIVLYVVLPCYTFCFDMFFALMLTCVLFKMVGEYFNDQRQKYTCNINVVLKHLTSHMEWIVPLLRILFIVPLSHTECIVPLLHIECTVRLLWSDMLNIIISNLRTFSRILRASLRIRRNIFINITLWIYIGIVILDSRP